MEIRSSKEIASKWSKVTPTRQAYYKSGVESPKKDWGSQTEAAAETWNAAITQAAAEGRFAKGVKEAGTAKWKRKTISVGVGRWQGGVSVAAPDFEKGFAPFADVISRTILPPRYPKGDPRNIDRVKAVADALHAEKIK
jgi:hypothetical protein